MEIKRGIAVSPGVAIGPALVLDAEAYLIPQRYVEGDLAVAELTRLKEALAAAAAEARANQQAVSEQLGPQMGAVFGAHALLLEDPSLTKEIQRLIQEKDLAAEFALTTAI